MKKSILLIIFTSITILSIAQKTKGSIGLSIPVIWNNSEVVYYLLGNPKYRSGKAVSYGVNINYSKPLYKRFYGKVGIGYYEQNFNINRPFNYYDNPGQLLFSTESYSYKNIQILAGIGYAKELSKNSLLNTCISYNYFYSFKQKYIVNKDSKFWQRNNKSFGIGGMVNLDIGITRNVSKKVSLGWNFIIPAYTHWKSDEIFISNNYSKDEKQIASNRFSVGINFSCNYNF